MRALLVAALILGVAGCSKPQEPAQPANEQASADMPAKGVDRSHKGQFAPEVAFKNPDGGEIRLAAFKGAPVLVNLWATWCAPCVKELPTLDALSRSHRIDGKLGVIAVSQDMGPHPSVVAFLNTHKIVDLGAYHDPEMHLSGKLNAPILPTSVLFDANGREVWRYVGDLDWTGPEATKLLAEAEAPSAG